MTEDGWIGGKPTENLFNAVLDEYSVQGRDKVAEIEEQAKSKGVREKSINQKRSSLSRYFFGSAVAELKKRVPCEVKIIDE